MSNGEIFEIMYDYDVLGLGKIWLKEGEEIYLKDFVFKSKGRKRTVKRGHQPGGIGVLINKEILNRVQIVELQMEEVLWVVYKNSKENLLLAIGIIYNHPMGSKYYNKRFYENLSGEIKTINNKFRNYQVLLIGDFNARTGQLAPYINIEAIDNEYERERYEVNSRASKDIVVNREGVKLVELCSENNLIIANGTIDADLEGDFNARTSQLAPYINTGAIDNEYERER